MRKPFLSLTIDDGKKSVLGFAPMNTKSPDVGSFFIAPSHAARRWLARNAQVARFLLENRQTTAPAAELSIGARTVSELYLQS
jgi:hypothetical protein